MNEDFSSKEIKHLRSEIARSMVRINELPYLLKRYMKACKTSGLSVNIDEAIAQMEEAIKILKQMSLLEWIFDMDIVYKKRKQLKKR